MRSHSVAMSNNIAKIREMRGLTQEELALRANTHNVTISKLENGKQNLTQNWMNRLAAALNVNPIDLIDLSPSIEKSIIHQNDLPKISARIENLLKERNLSRAEVSHAAGRPNAIQMLYRAAQAGTKHKLTKDVLADLALALGVSVEFLLTGKEPVEQIENPIADFLPRTTLEPALSLVFQTWLLSIGLTAHEAEVTAPSAARLFLQSLSTLPKPPKGLSLEQLALAESARLIQQFSVKKDRSAEALRQQAPSRNSLKHQ